MQSRRRWPWVVGALILALAALVLCWDWNWFRPQVAREAGAALGRQLSIGHLSLHLGRNPELVADDIAIANPDGFPPGSRTATLGRLRLRIDPRALFHHSIKLTEIELDQPSAELGLDPAGVPNWKLQGSSSSPFSPSPWTVDIPSAPGSTTAASISLDPKLKSDFQLEVHTEDLSPAASPTSWWPSPAATPGQPISGRFVGGSVLGLRDANDRYPIDLKLDHGATRVRLTGSLLEPLKFGGADLRLDLEGDDLASLYPLTGIPLAPTAPLQARWPARLRRATHPLPGLPRTGTVGSSDLEGDVEVDLGRARSYVTASLSSRRVALADLAGFIGAAPGEADSPRQAPKQKAEHARQEASPKLLPDTPINLPKLRSADLDVRYRAQHIEGKTPLDNLDATLTVADGALSLHPLSFAVGQGQIVFNIRLSGEQNLVRTVADVDFRQVELARIMQSLGGFKGAGTIGGKASIDTTGNSLAQMLGRGNGEMKLFMDGGDISALLVWTRPGLPGNGLESALAGIPRAGPSCAAWSPTSIWTRAR